MFDSKIRKEGLLVFVLYLLLLYVTIFIPIIELISIFVLPIPFIVFSARHGWKPTLVVFFLSLFVSFFFAPLVAIPFTVLAGVGGILIGLSINGKLSAYETWARGTLGFLVGIVFVFVLVQALFDVNLIDQLNQMVTESVRTSQELLKGFGLNLTTDELRLIEEQMRQVTYLLPVIFVTIAMIIGFISQWISYKVLNRIGDKKLLFPPFRNFQLPKAVIWIYFIAILFTWFNLEPGSVAYQGVMNVTNLAGLLTILQGFSFIFYYVYKKKRMSKAIPIITIVICILFPFIGLYIVRILGIIDLGFSLRERIVDTK